MFTNINSRLRGGKLLARRVVAVGFLALASTACEKEAILDDQMGDVPLEVVAAASASGSSMSFQKDRLPNSSYDQVKDALIKESTPTDNRGDSDIMAVDGDIPTGSGDDIVSLLHWDISAIPSGAKVTGVSITLNVFDGTDDEYTVRGINHFWREDEATWIKRTRDTDWQDAGALGNNDRGSEVLARISPSQEGSYTFSLNADGRAWVQEWINGKTSNKGLMIEGRGSKDYFGFSSSEASDKQARPKLTIQYTSGGDSQPDGKLVWDGDGIKFCDNLSGLSCNWTSIDFRRSGVNGESERLRYADAPGGRSGNAVEVEIRKGDYSIKGKSERMELRGPAVFPGDETRYEWYMYFGNDFKPAAGGTFNIITQFIGPIKPGTPKRKHAFSISVRKRDGREYLQSVIMDAVDERIDLGDLPRNKWVKFVLTSKWSSGNNGYHTLDMNGERAINYNGPTIYSNSIKLVPKQGIYRGYKSSNETSRLWIDDAKRYDLN